MLIRLIRLLFFPLSVLYGLVIDIRNYQFNKGLKSQISMEPTIISVGNLSTGGTGKTPMVEYLIRFLKDKSNLATLSRGYGRKTRGYRLVNDQDTFESVGDEPLQYYKKFGEDIHVVVCEERVLGVSSLMLDYPDKEVFLLDDAYQHRFLQRDLNILLTSFEAPFFNDCMLPTGNLREHRKEAKRADAIVVTKCPTDLNDKIKDNYISKINLYNKTAPVFFSSIKYGDIISVFDCKKIDKEAVLISGIANPTPLVNHFNDQLRIQRHFTFPDHYQFRAHDLDHVERFMDSQNLTSIVTTEKDMVRLLPHRDHSIFKTFSLFYVPIEVEIDNTEAFNEMVLKTLKG